MNHRFFARALSQNPMPLLPVAPAVFIGTQQGTHGLPSIELWNLTANIEGHCVGSTVSSQTLTAAGYRLPVKF